MDPRAWSGASSGFTALSWKSLVSAQPSSAGWQLLRVQRLLFAPCCPGVFRMVSVILGTLGHASGISYSQLKLSSPKLEILCWFCLLVFFCCCWVLAQTAPTRYIHLDLLSCSKPDWAWQLVTRQYLPPQKHRLIFFSPCLLHLAKLARITCSPERQISLNLLEFIYYCWLCRPVQLRPCDPPISASWVLGNRCALPHLARFSL